MDPTPGDVARQHVLGSVGTVSCYWGKTETGTQAMTVASPLVQVRPISKPFPFSTVPPFRVPLLLVPAVLPGDSSTTTNPSKRQSCWCQKLEGPVTNCSLPNFRHWSS